MTLYLEQFDWKHGNIEIVKLVKVSLTDEQLNVLLNFMVKSTVKALVLSGNNLTDVSLDALLNFVTLNNALKNVYLPKNYVNILKSKPKINLLKDKGVNIYIWLTILLMCLTINIIQGLKLRQTNWVHKNT